VSVLANPLAFGRQLRHVISISINSIGSSRRNGSCFQPKKALLYTKTMGWVGFEVRIKLGLNIVLNKTASSNRIRGGDISGD
jgi:hypothetical protein